MDQIKISVKVVYSLYVQIILFLLDDAVILVGKCILIIMNLLVQPVKGSIKMIVKLVLLDIKLNKDGQREGAYNVILLGY